MSELHTGYRHHTVISIVDLELVVDLVLVLDLGLIRQRIGHTALRVCTHATYRATAKMSYGIQPPYM